jgi:hypothetical protein
MLMSSCFFAGFKEPKTYLVLLQNSNELRPTGGFIGSVGKATFEEGVLTDFAISDVYELDGQLKGHVDPPEPMKYLLGLEHWYLRDSNWDPDFKISGQKAAWFYEKESGVQVDGVIALNVPVIVDLLTATGPIRLPDYNDVISADNFFGKSFYYTQNNFFPGSTQKSDFLGTLSRALTTTLTSDKSVNSIAVFRAITAGLMRKDILFMFTDPDMQQFVEHFRWAGRVPGETGCEGVDKEFCMFDPIIAAEANMSVSKVNYFIKRDAQREISITPDGVVTQSYSLTLRNTSNILSKEEERGKGGNYIPYIRFFVPDNTQMDDITLDGVPIHYIENSVSEGGLRAVGVAVDIQPGTKHTIRVTLTRTTPLVFGRGGTVLDVFNSKHPGVSDETIHTTIRYPIYWKVTDESKVKEVTQTLVAKEGQLEYNSTISQDQMIRLRFMK